MKRGGSTICAESSLLYGEGLRHSGERDGGESSRFCSSPIHDRKQLTSWRACGSFYVHLAALYDDPVHLV